MWNLKYSMFKMKQAYLELLKICTECENESTLYEDESEKLLENLLNDIMQEQYGE